MSVTIKDIAQKAGVATSTVSRALTGSSLVSKKTTEQIKKLAKELDYHPNMVARSLVSKEADNISVVFPTSIEKTLNHPFYNDLLRGIASASRGKNKGILLCGMDKNVSEFENISKIAISGQTDGMILLSPNIEDETIQRLNQVDFPFVVIGRPIQKNIFYVDNDNVRAGRDITLEFIKRGHRNIVFLGGTPHVVVLLDRIKGYKDALTQSNLEFKEENIVYSEFMNNEIDYEGLAKRFLAKDGPTAVIAGDDFYAFELMRKLHEIGLSVPFDVSVAGFNNVQLCSYSFPRLTSVDVKNYELGKKAMFMLMNLLSKSKNSEEFEIVPFEIVHRDSIADAKK